MFAVIFIPDFSLQSVLRHEPDARSRAVALFDSEADGVVQVTATAAEAGVVPGMTASQAMARCEVLAIKGRSSVQETIATETLLQTTYAFSPNIESTMPGVCTMDLKGLRLDGKIEEWVAKIRKILSALHLEAQVGIGPTPELALLDARSLAEFPPGFGARQPPGALSPAPEKRQRAAAVQDAVARFSELPLSALEPSQETLEILSRWGISTIGEFLAFDKNDIAERLGPGVLALFERMSADSVRPFKRVSPPESFVEQIEFEHEVETTEPLLFVLNRFVEQLSRRLEIVYRVVAGFDLTLGLSSGAKYERTFKVPSPTGRREVLFRMLQTHLETVRTDSAIVSLRLIALPARPETHQFGLFESTLRDPNQFAETLARLAAVVGSENVGTPVLEATHRPDSFHMAVPSFDSSLSRTAISDLPSPICLRRFRPAIRIQIEFQQEKPVAIRGRPVDGTVTQTRGPF